MIPQVPEISVSRAIQKKHDDAESKAVVGKWRKKLKQNNTNKKHLKQKNKTTKQQSMTCRILEESCEKLIGWQMRPMNINKWFVQGCLHSTKRPKNGRIWTVVMGWTPNTSGIIIVWLWLAHPKNCLKQENLSSKVHCGWTSEVTATWVWNGSTIYTPSTCFIYYTYIIHTKVNRYIYI